MYHEKEKTQKTKNKRMNSSAIKICLVQEVLNRLLSNLLQYATICFFYSFLKSTNSLLEFKTLFAYWSKRQLAGVPTPVVVATLCVLGLTSINSSHWTKPHCHVCAAGSFGAFSVGLHGFPLNASTACPLTNVIIVDRFLKCHSSVFYFSPL